MWEYNYLSHHGVKGQKWYVRRYQNKDGSLTPYGKRHVAEADNAWAKKYSDKVMQYAKSESQSELNAYGRELLKLPDARNANGKLSAKTINAYNQKMAEVMSRKTSDIKAPSGRVVSFVAKRGEIGVFTALSDYGYDPNQFKNGIYESGRIAYRKKSVNKINV